MDTGRNEPWGWGNWILLAVVGIGIAAAAGVGGQLVMLVGLILAVLAVGASFFAGMAFVFLTVLPFTFEALGLPKMRYDFWGGVSGVVGVFLVPFLAVYSPWVLAGIAVLGAMSMMALGIRWFWIRMTGRADD